jgi:hypothetical protein
LIQSWDDFIEENAMADTKKIVLEMSGGPWDGLSPDTQRAQSFLALTEGGTVGQAFMTASPAAIQRLHEPDRPDLLREEGHRYHKYKITDRVETDDEIRVTAIYVGPMD